MLTAETLSDKFSIFFTTALNLIHGKEYSLLLHKHLGDVFYAIGCYKRFKSVYGSDLNFLVRPNHEFLMELYEITSYKVIDIDSLIKTNSLYKSLSKKKKDVIEDIQLQELFPQVPVKNVPFICENPYLHEFSSYDNYWCYRWAENMLLGADFKFPVPKAKLKVTPSIENFLAKISKELSKIIVIAPDAETSLELPIDFWRSLVSFFQKKEYLVIINSNKYRFKGTINTFDERISLRDLVYICQNCAAVFSLRSGLCDVLVGIGKRLYVFNPAMFRREQGSLNYPFSEPTCINEIQLLNWKAKDFYFNGDNLYPLIQPTLKRLRKCFWLSLFSEKLFLNKEKNIFLRRWANNLAGNGRGFPDNNINNPKPYREFFGGNLRYYK